MQESKKPEQETLAEWLKRCPNFLQVDGGIFNRLANRTEMEAVWEWHAKFARDAYKSQLALAIPIQRSRRFPGKPGNMPPRERAQYFQKVQRHTSALIELLKDTRYQGEWIGDLIPEENLDSSILRDLEPWQSEETPESTVVGYLVTHDGVHKLSWDYPQPHLVEMLQSVIEWSKDTDYWDRDPFVSSKPIAQGSNSITTGFFNRTFFERVSRHQLEIPFPILATICNVALDLPADQMIDEETVRKQIRRHQKRG